MICLVLIHATILRVPKGRNVMLKLIKTFYDIKKEKIVKIKRRMKPQVSASVQS